MSLCWFCRAVAHFQFFWSRQIIVTLLQPSSASFLFVCEKTVVIIDFAETTLVVMHIFTANGLAKSLGVIFEINILE